MIGTMFVAAANVTRSVAGTAARGVAAGARAALNVTRAGARVAWHGARAGVRLAGPWWRSVGWPWVKWAAGNAARNAADNLSSAWHVWQQHRASRRGAGPLARVLTPRRWRLRRGEVDVALVDGVVRVWSTARPQDRLEFSPQRWEQFIEQVRDGEHDFENLLAA